MGNTAERDCQVGRGRESDYRLNDQLSSFRLHHREKCIAEYVCAAGDAFVYGFGSLRRLGTSSGLPERCGQNQAWRPCRRYGRCVSRKGVLRASRLSAAPSGYNHAHTSGSLGDSEPRSEVETWHVCERAAETAAWQTVDCPEFCRLSFWNAELGVRIPG